MQIYDEARSLATPGLYNNIILQCVRTSTRCPSYISPEYRQRDKEINSVLALEEVFSSRTASVCSIDRDGGGPSTFFFLDSASVYILSKNTIIIIINYIETVWRTGLLNVNKPRPSVFKVWRRTAVRAEGIQRFVYWSAAVAR